MKIVTYAPEYREAFIALNTAWIEENFGQVEQADWDTFSHIEEALAAGAMIYFAVEGETVLATCMVRPAGDGVYELCKLAADNRYKKQGAGGKVFQACMEYAKAQGATKLIIISNDKLAAAMHLYEKYGFREKKLEHCVYDRGNIAFERLITA